MVNGFSNSPVVACREKNTIAFVKKLRSLSVRAIPPAGRDDFAALAPQLPAYGQDSSNANVSSHPNIGINLAPDWLCADNFRLGRKYFTQASANGKAAVDSEGWPTEDCSKIVWEGHAYNEGAYALSFNGKATIALSAGYGTVDGAESSAGAYDPATNTTTAAVQINPGSQNCSLIFHPHATDAGQRAEHRYHQHPPLSPGVGRCNDDLSSGYVVYRASHRGGKKVFRRPAAVRRRICLGLRSGRAELAGSQPARRLEPKSAGGTPMAYELLVAFCNQAKVDLYVDVPCEASPDFITKLAQLLKYGSDGVSPYTSAQDKPVWAPLDPGLHVYLEYSNEVWNWAFKQAQVNLNTVKADQAANNAEWAVLAYDGTTNMYEAACRRVAYKIVEISDAFPFGFTEMRPCRPIPIQRCAPLLEFQVGNGQNTAAKELTFLSDYYDNGDGVAHVTVPHPPNYFLWGGGGASYYNSNNDKAATVDDLFASGIPSTGIGHDIQDYQKLITLDTDWVKGFGLKRVAYEGGWAVANGEHGMGNRPGSPAAVAKFDPRAATAELLANTIFQQSGGDLNIFFQSSSWAPSYGLGNDRQGV